MNEALRIVDFFKKEYDILITTPDTVEFRNNRSGTYRADKIIEWWMILFALQRLRRAIVRLPPEAASRFVKEINIAGIIEIEPRPNHDYPVSGFASYPTRRITLSIERILRDNSGKSVGAELSLQPHTIMHEICHLIFPETEESFYRTFFITAYGEGVNVDHGYDEQVLETDAKHKPGFSSVYGQTNVYEDVATILGELLDPIERQYILRLAQKDPVLQKKTDFLQKTFIERVGVPATYWDDFEAGRVNMEYWQRHGLLLRK